MYLMTTTQKILVSTLNCLAICDTLNRTLSPLGIRVEFDESAPALWSFWDEEEILGASDSLLTAIVETLATARRYLADEGTGYPRTRVAQRLSAQVNELVRLSEVVS